VKISVIIPVHDDPRVRSVVASLLEELPPDGEILVADDGPPGSLPPLPGTRIVAVHSGNPGNARNQAARLAQGEVLLFLDADVVVPSGWVGKAVSIFEDRKVPAAQGYTEAVGRDAVARRMQEEYDRFVASHDATGHRDFCDTRCFGIRREVFEGFQFHVEEPYCEDGVLGRRLFEANIPIRFVREWRVGHHYTRSPVGELYRLRRYAAASAMHLHRTGRDLFRAPGAAAPHGPGASLLQMCARWPAFAPPAAALLWLAALAVGAGAAVPEPWGRRLFAAARRAAFLSARLAQLSGADGGARATPPNAGTDQQ
jgi:glycosyltransferase involved in cell wall biosynthesis